MANYEVRVVRSSWFGGHLTIIAALIQREDVPTLNTGLLNRIEELGALQLCKRQRVSPVARMEIGLSEENRVYKLGGDPEL